MNSLKVTNDLGESLIIELARPAESGFAILYIEGLGPAKGVVNLTERAGLSGSSYNSARAEHRNIIIGLKFWGSNIADRRRDTYKYFPLTREIRLEVDSGKRRAYAYGYVESNEPSIFSDNSGCTISILCPKSTLYDIDEAITTFSSVTSLFTFPFSNESLVDPLINISELIIETEKTVLYYGDSNVGMVLHIHANDVASGIEITNSRTLESLSINDAKLIALTGSGIVEGDNFYISTVHGNKYAKLIRGSVEYNILNCLGLDPTWFQLQTGDNLFAYTALTGLPNLEFEIRNDIAYDGV